MSAIFGASDQCVAVHPSDLCVALAAMDAEIVVQSANGTRTIPMKDFHRLPDQTPERDTNIEKGELITEIFIPKNPFAKHTEYLKIRDRASYAFALVSVAVALYVDGNGRIADARVCVGGVAHKPWRLFDTESRLRNTKAIWDSDFERLAKIITAAAAADAKPLKNNGFKVDLLQNTLITALKNVLS
jgi:xanthine dehydrogenase YagS FAD-binding subunit